MVTIYLFISEGSYIVSHRIDMVTFVFHIELLNAILNAIYAHVEFLVSYEPLRHAVGVTSSCFFLLKSYCISQFKHISMQLIDFL